MLVDINGRMVQVSTEGLPLVIDRLSPELEQVIEATRRRSVTLWLQDPARILSHMTKAYNGVLRLCPLGDYERNIVTDDTLVSVEYFVATQITPFILAKRIELARFTEPSLPVTAAILTRVAVAALHPEPRRLTKALRQWKESIEALKVWVRLAVREQDLIDLNEIARRLAIVGIEISVKRLNNHHKKAWGAQEGKRGNAALFDWIRIRPIIEGQFSVKFKE